MGEHADQKHRSGFSKPTAICFTLNYIVGTGFLTIPWAFYTGGIILSTLTMAVVILICNITKNYVLESMAIAEELVELHVVEDHDLDDTEEDSEEEDTKSTQVIDEESSLLSSEQVANSADSGYQQHQHAHHEHSRNHGTDYYGSTWVNPCYETFEEAIEHTKPAEVYAHHHQYEEVHQEPEPRPPIIIGRRHVEDYKGTASSSTCSAISRLVVKQRKFEITALCRLFLGAWGEKTYVISIALDIYGCLWGFTSVFASSLALALPFSNHYEADYTLYALVYAILVIPLSCLELKEQVMFHVMYSCCRFLIIFVTIITSLVAIDDENNVHFTNMPDGAAEPTRMFKFDGFYTAFSVLVFTSIMHAAIPVLSQPVHDKTKLSSIFKDTFLITGVLFWLLGYSVTTYFGSSIEQASNLNWSTYVGGSGGPSPNDPSMWINVAWWARTMSMFVLGFPALNVISSFPLNTVALGNNLMAAVFGDGVHEAEKNRRLVILFRLLSSIPPLIGAMFVSDLGVITAWTGIVAIATAFPIPALLYIGSIRFASDHGLYQYETYYDGFGSSVACAWVVVAFSIFAMICITKTLLEG